MVRIDLVRAKIGRLKDTVGALRGGLPPAGATSASRDTIELASFRVYLGVQEAIDLCAHIIADQGWGPVPSLREHFTMLATKGVLEAELAAQLAAGVKVRNLIAHAYAEVDAAKLFAAAYDLADLLEAFCREILGFAESGA
jgi:uncharacterized protein YutE (UPF0331/DUF86 family)